MGRAFFCLPVDPGQLRTSTGSAGDASSNPWMVADALNGRVQVGESPTISLRACARCCSVPSPAECTSPDARRRSSRICVRAIRRRSRRVLRSWCCRPTAPVDGGPGPVPQLIALSMHRFPGWSIRDSVSTKSRSGSFLASRLRRSVLLSLGLRGSPGCVAECGGRAEVLFGPTSWLGGKTLAVRLADETHAREAVAMRRAIYRTDVVE